MDVKESLDMVNVCDFIISITRTECTPSMGDGHLQISRTSKSLESQEEELQTVGAEEEEITFPQKKVHLWTAYNNKI